MRFRPNLAQKFSSTQESPYWNLNPLRWLIWAQITRFCISGYINGRDTCDQPKCLSVKLIDFSVIWPHLMTHMGPNYTFFVSLATLMVETRTNPPKCLSSSTYWPQCKIIPLDDSSGGQITFFISLATFMVERRTTHQNVDPSVILHWGQ